MTSVYVTLEIGSKYAISTEDMLQSLGMIESSKKVFNYYCSVVTWETQM